MMGYMEVATTEPKTEPNEYLLEKGTTDKDVHALADLVVGQELGGNQFSPLAESWVVS